jgi:hypothetical protein
MSTADVGIYACKVSNEYGAATSRDYTLALIDTNKQAPIDTTGQEPVDTTKPGPIDTSGQAPIDTTKQVQIDTTKPLITLLSHKNGQTVTTSPVTIIAGVSDSSGISFVLINHDTAKTTGAGFEKSIPLSTGGNEITIEAADKSKNRNVAALTFSLLFEPTAQDSSPPVITLLSHKDGQTVTDTSITIAVQAHDDNGVKFVALNKDTITETGGSYRKNVRLQLGSNSFTVVARDNSVNGNRDSIHFAIICDPTAFDSTGPTITPVSHSPGQVVANSAISFKAAAKDTCGISLVTINGSPVTGAEGVYSKEITLTAGSNTIVIVATDNSTAKNSDTLFLAIIYDPTAEDTSGPVITISSHSDGQVLTVQPVVLKVTVNDQNGVSSVTINGDTVQPKTGNSYEKEITLQEGSNTVAIEALDNSRKKNVSQKTLNLTYDPPPKAISLSQPNSVAFSSMEIEWTVSLDFDFASYALYSSTTANVTTSSNLVTTITDKAKTSHSLSGLSESTTYYIKVFVYDQNGSYVPSNEVSAKTIEMPAPTITVTAPALVSDSGTVRAPASAIAGSATSPGAISSVSASINGTAATVSGTANWSFSGSALSSKQWNRIIITATDNTGTFTTDTFYVFLKPALTAPSAPSIGERTYNSIALTWQAVANCTHYRIYRSSTESGALLFVTEINNATSYTDKNLAINSQYWYAVSGAYYATGNVSDSTDISPSSTARLVTVWQKIFTGTPGLGHALDLTNDGGYILCGYDPDYGRIRKINSSGAEVWPVLNIYHGKNNSVITLGDSGYITCGNTSSELYVTRLANDKTEIWSEDYLSKSWNGVPTFYGITPNGYGGYSIAETCVMPGTGTTPGHYIWTIAA